jgi:sugar phosphate permease
MRDTVLPLATNPRFWFVAGMAFTSTACRESLLCYTSKYYEKVFQASSGLCAMIPAIINIASAISVISGGFVFDKVPKKNRGLVMSLFFGAASAMFLVLLAFTKILIANDSASGSNVIVASVLIFITALFLSPPNSFLDGVCAVDLSGPNGVAFASGVISAFGYAGSVCVSVVFGQLLGEGASAWPTLWGLVALSAGTSSLIAILYWMFEVRRLNRLQRQIEVEKFMKSLQAKA